MVRPRGRQRKRALNQALSHAEIKSIREIAKLDGKILSATTPVGHFLERYLVSEAVARKLIAYKTRKPCPQTLNFQSIVSASKHFYLAPSIHPQLIENVFRGGAGHRNSKTPRQLRNSIVHSLSREDCVETRTRHHDLMALMKRWLDHFV